MGVPPSPHLVHMGREGQKQLGRGWGRLLCSLCCLAEWSQGRGAYLCALLCIPHLCTEVGGINPACERGRAPLLSIHVEEGVCVTVLPMTLAQKVGPGLQDLQKQG